MLRPYPPLMLSSVGSRPARAARPPGDNQARYDLCFGLSGQDEKHLELL